MSDSGTCQAGHALTPDNLYSYDYAYQKVRRCRTCENARHKALRIRHADRIKARRQRPEAKRRAFGRWLNKEYGLSLEQFDAMVLQQKGRCAICRCAMTFGGKCRTKAAVDHCHATGKVRGLLCWHCNAAVGLLKDSPKSARALARYLERSAPPQGTNAQAPGVRGGEWASASFLPVSHQSESSK